MCYLSDFLIDCSENRGVKEIYKRNSKAITQFFDGWNGDALLGGIKHTVNGGPVSYTHLDVYKRQRMGFSDIAIRLVRSSLDFLQPVFSFQR